jgi:hypothetical protein
VSEAISAAVAKFREAYHQQMTSVMYMAGSAMAPALNRAALEDRDALEKLVVRNIPRPSPRSVLVGDVVAFNSPLALGSSPVVTMVRRVAAMEGEEMVALSSSSSSSSREGEAASEAGEQEDSFTVPKGHCWVLADNENLKPPQVRCVCQALLNSCVCVMHACWCSHTPEGYLEMDWLLSQLQ